MSFFSELNQSHCCSSASDKLTAPLSFPTFCALPLPSPPPPLWDYFTTIPSHSIRFFQVRVHTNTHVCVCVCVCVRCKFNRFRSQQGLKSGLVRMWTRIPPTFPSSKEWHHCNVCSQKTSLAAAGSPWRPHITRHDQPLVTAQLHSQRPAKCETFVLWMCIALSLQLPDRFCSAWEDVNTGQLCYRKKTE